MNGILLFSFLHFLIGAVYVFYISEKEMMQLISISMIPEEIDLM